MAGAGSIFPIPPVAAGARAEALPAGPKPLGSEAASSKNNRLPGLSFPRRVTPVSRSPCSRSPEDFAGRPGVPARCHANVGPDITPPEGMAGSRRSPGASLPSPESEGGIRRDLNPLPPSRCPGDSRRASAGPTGVAPSPAHPMSPGFWGQREPGRATQPTPRAAERRQVLGRTGRRSVTQ